MISFFIFVSSEFINKNGTNYYFLIIFSACRMGLVIKRLIVLALGKS